MDSLYGVYETKTSLKSFKLEKGEKYANIILDVANVYGCQLPSFVIDFATRVNSAGCNHQMCEYNAILDFNNAYSEYKLSSGASCSWIIGRMVSAINAYDVCLHVRYEDGDPGSSPGDLFPPPAPGGGGGNGGTPSPVQSLSPCDGVTLANAITSNSLVRNIINQIKSKTVEHGAKIYVTNPINMNSVNVNGTTSSDENNAWSPGLVTWDSNKGYVIGFIHNHPAKSPTNPSDVFNGINITQMENQLSIPAAQVNFYVQNFSSTIVTSQSIYTVTIKDVAKFQQVQNSFDQTAANDKWLEEAKIYLAKKSLGTEQDAGEYALLKLFGDAIHLNKQKVNENNNNKNINISNNKPTANNPC